MTREHDSLMASIKRSKKKKPHTQTNKQKQTNKEIRTKLSLACLNSFALVGMGFFMVKPDTYQYSSGNNKCDAYDNIIITDLKNTLLDNECILNKKKESDW